MRVRLRTEIVEARQYDANKQDEFFKWCKLVWVNRTAGVIVDVRLPDRHGDVRILEDGDWVLEYPVPDGYEVVKKDDFDKLYEEVIEP